MEYEDQQCLRLFLLETKRYREKFSKDSNKTANSHQQKTITTFFISITSSHARVLTTTLKRGYNRFNINYFSCKYTRLSRSKPHHTCYPQRKAIITQPQRCFSNIRDISILDWPILEIFQGRNFNLSKLKILGA